MRFDFVLEIIPVRLPQWSSRPWQDLLQPAKSHVLGTFRDDGKLTSYGFGKIGDDFVMCWAMITMIYNDNNLFFDFKCVASWNCHNTKELHRE